MDHLELLETLKFHILYRTEDLFPTLFKPVNISSRSCMQTNSHNALTNVIQFVLTLGRSPSKKKYFA